MNASAAGIGPVPFYCWNNRSNSYSHPNKRSAAYRRTHARPAALCASSGSSDAAPPLSRSHLHFCPASARANMSALCVQRETGVPQPQLCCLLPYRCRQMCCERSLPGHTGISKAEPPLSAFYFGREMLSGRISPPNQSLFSPTKAISFSGGLPCAHKARLAPSTPVLQSLTLPATLCNCDSFWQN